MNNASLMGTHFIAEKLECVTDGLQTLIRYSYRFDVDLFTFACIMYADQTSMRQLQDQLHC